LYEVERLRLTAEFFQRATRLSPRERDAFLEAEVPDTRMREDVRELLEARASSRKGVDDAESDTYHDRRRAFATQFARPSEEVGLPQRIGPYRIVRRLGTGSAGIVYEAEEERPRRSVALKVLHPEMVSEEGLRRFEREANSLARVVHRGIAQIYAFGQSADPDHPQPYIALELIRGKRLTDHADAHKLDLRARVALFLRVCDAVQHAHQQGVLHRDLKPSNIIVTEEGRPKVLDFSVACDTEHAVPADSGRVLVGTLAYMSPEQSLGDPTDIDTRTDVYALGVIGYELLAGSPPLDIDGLPPAEATRMLTEVWPLPLGAHRRNLRGDLTWIFGKALAKSKDERYESVSALADDLRRKLRKEPVNARPATAWYRLTCFLRRYRTLVGSAALVLTAMIAGIVLAMRSADSAHRYQRIAEENRADAERAAYAASLQVAADHTDAHEERSARRILNALSPEESPWEWRHVKAALESDTVMVPLQHAGSPVAGWSPDGRWLVDVCAGSRIVVYDVDRRHASTGPGVPGNKGVAIGVDSSGTRLYWAGDDGTLLVHDREWKLLHSFDGVPRHVVASADGHHLIVSVRGEDSRSRIEYLNAQTGAVQWSWAARAHAEKVDLSRSGTRLVIGDAMGFVTVLDTSDGSVVWATQLHTERLSTVRFSPDGSRIATGSRDQVVQVVDAHSGQSRMHIELLGSGVSDVAFSGDSNRLASAHAEGVVRYWDLSGGTARELRRTAAVGETAWEARVETMRWNDRTRVVSVLSRDGLRLHANEAAPAKPALYGHRTRAEGNAHPYVSAVSFDPRGGAVASAGWDGTVRIWDTATNRMVRVLLHERDSVVRGCVYLKGGNRLVSYSRTSDWSSPTLHLWAVDTGVLLKSWTCPQRIAAMAYSAESRTLALATGSQVRLLSESLEPKGQGKQVPVSLRSVAFGANGTLLFAGAESGACYLIRLTDTTPFRSWKGHHGAITDGAFDASGARLATVALDSGALRVWDVRSGRLELENRGDTGRYCVRWSPDGSRLFTGSKYPAITVLDATDGRSLLSLRGHRGFVSGLALSRDGAILASSSGDNTVRLWHTHAADVRGERMRRALASSER